MLNDFSLICTNQSTKFNKRDLNGLLHIKHLLSLRAGILYENMHLRRKKFLWSTEKLI